ncbi:MAG TPA: ABC transporter ATP-binding protein [Nitrososphaerales archaeon]|nr:ABC transporter ATP-binding protein [Nitrososphaerales archaeon]
MLEVEGVTKRYKKFTALDKVSVDLEDGATALLLGPNGAGKTTLLRCILGLVEFSGTIEVGGRNVVTDNKRAKAMIGYVPQYSSFYEGMKVLDQAHLIAKLKRRENGEVKEKLEKVDLWEARNKQVSSLSSGMRQRLGLALALLGDPPLMIFDEPTSNVDLRGQMEFQHLLSSLHDMGKTLLITTHLSGLDDYASAAVVLDHGKVVAHGEPAQLLKQINAVDTIYVRVDDASLPKATEIAQGFSDAVATKGDWLLIPVPGSAKAGVIKSLISSCNVIDLLVEPATIESQYLRLLGGTN